MSKIKLTLKKSLIGSNKKQKATVACLGLKKIGQSVEVDKNPVIQGQIRKVSHLLSVEINQK